MPSSPVPDTLGERRHVTLILRLVLDRLQGLVYGEIVDADGRHGGHFRAWSELPGVVQSWIGRREKSAPQEPDEPC